MAQFSHGTQPPKQIQVKTKDGRTIEIAEEIAANFPDTFKPVKAETKTATTKETK